MCIWFPGVGVPASDHVTICCSGEVISSRMDITGIMTFQYNVCVTFALLLNSVSFMTQVFPSDFNRHQGSIWAGYPMKLGMPGANGTAN